MGGNFGRESHVERLFKSASQAPIRARGGGFAKLHAAILTLTLHAAKFHVLNHRGVQSAVPEAEWEHVAPVRICLKGVRVAQAPRLAPAAPVHDLHLREVDTTLPQTTFEAMVWL